DRLAFSCPVVETEPGNAEFRLADKIVKRSKMLKPQFAGSGPPEFVERTEARQPGAADLRLTRDERFDQVIFRFRIIQLASPGDCPNISFRKSHDNLCGPIRVFISHVQERGV